MVEILETGIKVIDSLAPYARAQDRSVRRSRRGKDRADPGVDPKRGDRARRYPISLPAWESVPVREMTWWTEMKESGVLKHHRPGVWDR